MEQFKILDDIAKRTNGDIYLGVVGPVRVGKSTFITRFMQNLILPLIDDENERTRIIDELPQSADGAEVMTTQPKFVPNKAVSIKSGDKSLRVRLVDCVGWTVAGATGYGDGEKPRYVKTPWQEAEMPFEKAAELGTKKVIKDHSTVAVAITTDGTITSIPRENYAPAEEKVIAGLKKSGKPFIVIVNSKHPEGAAALAVKANLEEKFGVAVLTQNLDKLSKKGINEIFDRLLAEFPITSFRVQMPEWLRVLPLENDVIAEAVNGIKNYTRSVRCTADNNPRAVFEGSQNFAGIETLDVDMASGLITYSLVPNENLYYKIISQMTGEKILTEASLVSYIKSVAGVKGQFDKLEDALKLANETGYGIVVPNKETFNLDTPKLYKNGKTYGVRLRATAPSLHIVKIDVGAVVTPIIGSEAQAQEMLKLLKEEYKNNREIVWQTPIFGRSLDTLMADGIAQKVMNMPNESKIKMKRTITKIVNNGRGGVICITF
ncbi:MAG: stage IV sporulation protein A [Christensenellaceae bacterium]|jgi:stage IV sporulation protein A|nr:stage IV sporulation protein A [Christensenellaceae bacterium]